MKHSIPALLWLSLIGWLTPAHAGEVLGRMSDDTAPVAAEPAAPPVADDRRIIYRVICSPEGEALPDCEKPFHDTESSVKPVPPQNIVEPGSVEEAQPVEEAAQPAKAKKSKKTAGKKKQAVKKAKKTASSKKTAAKKK
ncbi:hypothetical protein [Methylomonas rivi]|uniref:Cell envelope biogenesis protein TolA n=1 Tax=Methylomonas rivi TaxID=2952226 RepID=A0ABT1U8V3_9GAMM|nr:hypothetical protein [Methylomonas sp. WSC-6]MCQ8129516.1 hypothetical protein [Methylomonas sp. WSC-6]